MSCKINIHIQRYIDLVHSGKIEVCAEQIKLCDFIEHIFETENVYVDEQQLEKYLSYQKYFPYKLFEWEEFVFALHNCTYRDNGELRFPILFIYVGRGAGKNGYLAFEDFCLLTPTNGVDNYHIDIFAMSEEQAMQSWNDVYNILEENETVMKKFFYWNKEIIRNKKTGSEFRYRTSNAKTKDGGRPGKVDFDEYHAYENYRLIDVATTGLGKKRHPRRTIMSTDGLVRGGPLDDLIEKCINILDGDVPDNGTLPFLCRLDSDEEVDDKKNWTKSNPSLPYLPHLMSELELEYFDYTLNPVANTSFIAKRMNRPPQEMENAVTSWENITACNREIDESKLMGRPCVIGIDYMKTNDFLGAGLLYRVDGKDYWITHTWVCKQSADLNRIKAPLDVWMKNGLLTFVDAAEISPELPVIWLKNEAMKRNSNILMAGIDNYRYTLLARALREILNLSTEKGQSNINLLRPADEMYHIPLITSKFVNHNIAWGENPLMCWAANNSKVVTSNTGNMTYGKIEPKSRKTDPFKALVAAECVSEVLDKYDVPVPDNDIFDIGVMTY
jgi:phage terminase large subunit-like protein